MALPLMLFGMSSLSDANKTIGPSAPPMMETAAEEPASRPIALAIGYVWCPPLSPLLNVSVYIGCRKSICIYFIRSSMDESGGLMIRFPVWLFSRNRTPAQSRSSSKPLAFCLLLVSCSPVLTLYTIFASMIRFASGVFMSPLSRDDSAWLSAPFC